MVSENPFNEPTVLSEQKSSSSILTYTNFKSPERNFVAMAQVDSLSKTSVHLSPIRGQNIERSEKMSNHSNNSNDLEDDFHNSDIELTIEDSDDKDTISENEDGIVNKSTKNNLENGTKLVKDVESLESLDNDLSNTAHLVGTGFSADEFDQIDSLDAIDNASNEIGRVKIPNIASNSTDLDDRGKSSDSGDRIDDSLVDNSVQGEIKDTSKKYLNSTVEENPSSIPENERVRTSSAELERNNNSIEKIDESETPSVNSVQVQSSTSLELVSQDTVEKIESDIPFSDQEDKIQLKLEVEEKDSEESHPSNDDQSVKNPISSVSLVSKSEPIDDEKCQNNDSERVQPHTQSEINSSKPSPGAEDDVSKQVDETPVRHLEGVSRHEENSAQPSDDTSKQIEGMIIDEDSSSDAPLAKNIDEPNRNDSNVVETVAKVPPAKDASKRFEEICIDTDSSSEVNLVKNDGSNVDKSSENGNSKENDEISTDVSTSKMIPIDVDMESSENRIKVSAKITDIDDSSKQTEEMAIDSDSSLKTIPNGNIDESEGKRSATVIEEVTQNHTDLRGDHTPEPQTCDSDDRSCSRMIVDDDNDPKSVESAEIIIDSVESEIVELDDDDDLENAATVSHVSQQKFSQLFETTAKEIAHDDIGTEVVVADDDPIPSTSGLTSNNLPGIEISLDRLMTNENDSRKRKNQTQQDDSSLNEPLLVEKRAKISESETSDSCTIYQSSTDLADRKKKPPLNRARKHTSSTNKDKTFQEIEKKIKKSTSSGQDIFEEYDVELHDNDGEIINDTRCNDAAVNNDDNSYRITLNYDVVSKDILKNIFKEKRNKLTRRQLEEIVIQKCCEMISDSNEIGALRRQVADLQQAEMFRKQKILNLEKQISQLKAVCQRYLDQVKENPNKPANPIKITRSVGLQVARGESSPFVNFEPNQVAQKGPEKLKKLLTDPLATKKPATVLETYQTVPRQRTASPLSSSINHRASDPRLVNGNTRISSPLSSSNSPTHCSSPSIVNNSRIIKKTTQPSDDNAPVIDLTDKDDKSENESTVATKNLLAVNGTVVTYVPVKMNSDQNTRQIIKPGTSILVNGQLMTIQSTGKYPQPSTHPAPVPAPPPTPMMPGAKPLPPKPLLKIDKNRNGIMLAWEFPPNTVCAEIIKYQLYAYQETNVPPRTDLWKTVGEVTALPLPMACTLTQFMEGCKYHLIVRAVDIHNRCGPFSVPRTITL